MLDLYNYSEFTEQYVAYTVDVDDNPLRTMHNPKETSVVQKKIYLRNDSATKYYTDVKLQWGPTATTQNNPLGQSYKILFQNDQPTEAQWQAVSSGNELSIGDIGSESAANTDFLPCWIRVEFPRSTPQQTYQDRYISIFYEEGNVDV